jgi:hypothetical protein
MKFPFISNSLVYSINNFIVETGQKSDLASSQQHSFLKIKMLIFEGRIFPNEVQKMTIWMYGN